MLSGFQAFVLLSMAGYASGWLYYLDYGKLSFWWSLIWPIAIWLDHKVCDQCGLKAQERSSSRAVVY
jgi:hypothetical protein